MKTKIFGALLIAALAFTSAAQAQTQTPVINHRAHKLEHRINRGVRDGELTQVQAARLRNADRHIQHEKRRAIANGEMTATKREQIRRQERMLSHAIHHDEHDTRLRG